jgi:hypothetical protein
MTQFITSNLEKHNLIQQRALLPTYMHFFHSLPLCQNIVNGIYSERQKYGINSLKIKQQFFQKNLWTGQF